ncbi:Dihydrolipoyllysine-residue succinyltransferase component of 2-oxoglutarate dehydrogenase complex [Pirellula sp. SH-Sr6A]|uniref:2-oxoglutarate dehydrogenase complex dihydrolipoyllysine-residue succinyltransferase n=1 Tax=Pirellula sp. SH-Sr6A TaxID=1632865 RepID=UPI00078C9D78|nr:2-oxoglutarate dehydrogenase complex dihydrolipoyllysine-residue succinyltransferase [Pirellula sp. SH-Sr6A]AMV32998.1 Dihydrolipoyllysine-residue succinyltransferase component of 2-oxoglutarate dehydrogenase complex [Pirellula sp. SH-Sr6A]
MVDIVVPSVGESISEVQISKWLKKEGDWVAAGTDLVDLETEKASVQISAPEDGILLKILKNNEEFASVGDILATFQPAAKGASPSGSAAPALQPASAPQQPVSSAPASPAADPRVMPAAQRALDDHHLQATQVPATGPGGRLLKEDVVRYVSQTSPAAPAAPAPVAPAAPAPTKTVTGTLAPPVSAPTASTGMVQQGSSNRSEEVKPMSMIRRTIASRLVQAQHTAALLTTFNEVDMQPVMTLRNKYRDAFAEKHGVKLGFMSFFAKAACEALKRYPSVNAEIRGNNIVYRNYCDIGIAIGGGKGLVVPVLRNVEKMGFAEIERTIGEFASRAMANKLMPEDLEGGTFTISNGGIYGSLLSTPIVNPPQSGILGLHSIQERPIALNGEVVIRPMMYLALTYDHRIIDGREAVTFLKTIKEVIEDPSRLFLEI